MDSLTIVVSIVSIIGTISSITFAYFAFKRNSLNDKQQESKNDGIAISDIGYIKACVDRVEKNLTKVDERYRNILERLAKVEEAVANLTKRVDDL